MIEPRYKNGITVEPICPRVTWQQAFFHWLIEVLGIGKYANEEKEDEE